MFVCLGEGKHDALITCKEEGVVGILLGAEGEVFRKLWESFLKKIYLFTSGGGEGERGNRPPTEHGA